MPYTLCFSLSQSKRGAPVDGATTTVVGIIGDDPLVSRILGLLLEGAGYEASPLEEAAVLEDPSTALAGVDLVLFMPLLGDERKGELLGVMKGDQATAAVPLISLSTDMKAELDERTDSVLPWPWSTQALVRAIERAVHARGGGEPS
jgi:FixJ family two-component response regulator